MKIRNNEQRKEELERIKELLITIDMVNGFVKCGNLASPSIMRIVPRQQELLEKYEQNNESANVFVRDVHDANSIEFNTFGKHCIRGNGEELIIPELEKWYKNGYDFEKNSTNFVLAPGVIQFFEKLPNLVRVKYQGCLSEVCVKNAAITLRNYFDQVNRDIEVGVYEDAIDTYDAPSHNADEVTEAAIEDMKANGVKIYRKTN